jgi:hypothetical protein
VNDTQLFGIPHLLARGNSFLEAIVLYYSKYDLELQLPCLEDTHYSPECCYWAEILDGSGGGRRPTQHWVLNKNSHTVPTTQQRLVNEPRGTLECEVIAKRYGNQTLPLVRVGRRP